MIQVDDLVVINCDNPALLFKVLEVRDNNTLKAVLFGTDNCFNNITKFDIRKPTDKELARLLAARIMREYETVKE